MFAIDQPQTETLAPQTQERRDFTVTVVLGPSASHVLDLAANRVQEMEGNQNVSQDRPHHLVVTPANHRPIIKTLAGRFNNATYKTTTTDRAWLGNILDQTEACGTKAHVVMVLPQRPFLQWLREDELKNNIETLRAIPEVLERADRVTILLSAPDNQEFGQANALLGRSKDTPTHVCTVECGEMTKRDESRTFALTTLMMGFKSNEKDACGNPTVSVDEMKVLAQTSNEAWDLLFKLQAGQRRASENKRTRNTAALSRKHHL